MGMIGSQSGRVSRQTSKKDFLFDHIRRFLAQEEENDLIVRFGKLQRSGS
jgi:hypothetical protein